MKRLKAYVNLVKPKILLGVLGLFITSTLASAAPARLWIVAETRYHMGVMAALCLVAGSNALNNYLDRDLDSRMGRTGRRALPLGLIGSKEALTFSILLLALSLTLLVFAAGDVVWLAALALLSYIVLYTALFKRKTRFNVVAATPAVAAPVMAGWLVGHGSLDPVGLVFSAIAITWGLVHFWSLTIIFREDYRRAGVPTLPGSLGVRTASMVVASLSSFMAALSFLPAWLEGWGLTYLAGATILNAALLILSAHLLRRPTAGRRAWRLYKFSSPYILLLLLLVFLEKIV